ncbi:hypothetical protein GF312_09680 [Candidatus Poribacteria bacterium]|nr:hypothetical protein [Candidatus Poribacteria bacterium]
MDNIRLAIVGCGVMGNRHLAGLMELQKAGLSRFDFVAACDPLIDRASALAKKAREYFNTEVKAVEKLEDLAPLGVQAIDQTTVPWIHHTIAIKAMELGMHVMVEKPMGLTVKACKIMMKTAENSDCVLNVAENFHYDPMNRLARELVCKKIIGDARLMLHNGVSGGTGIIVTPWRHLKKGGGPILDVGVHNAYVTEYLMGKVGTVFAQARLHEKVRRSRSGSEPDEMNPDAEDAVYATLVFENGGVCQYIEDHAGHGKGLRHRSVYGSKGSMDLPSDRSGQPINMMLDGRGEVKGEQILDFVPDFSLNKVTSALFGRERLGYYEFPFPAIDAKLLAAEYADFADSILDGKKSEVDLINAMRSVALPYAMLESSKLGRAVTMSEIMEEKVHSYQDEINGMINL